MKDDSPFIETLGGCEPHWPVVEVKWPTTLTTVSYLNRHF